MLNKNKLFRLSLIILSVGLCCLALAGCTFPSSLYKMDIRQGNDITADMVKRLRKGMSKDAVQSILGTPAMQHMLNANRWDYYYYFKSGKTGKVIERHFTVFFKDGRLTHCK